MEITTTNSQKDRLETIHTEIVGENTHGWNVAIIRMMSIVLGILKAAC